MQGIGLIVGLIGLSAVLMAFIVFVARHFDAPAKDANQQVLRLDLSSPPPPEQNAKTREQPPYGPFTTPNSPGRPAGYKGDGGSGNRPSGSPPPKQAEPQEPPVGIPVEQYREAVESGKKVYLPNPKGECDLSGGIAKSADALDNCFAQRAAR